MAPQVVQGPRGAVHGAVHGAVNGAINWRGECEERLVVLLVSREMRKPYMPQLVHVRRLAIEVQVATRTATIELKDHLERERGGDGGVERVCEAVQR